MMARMWWTLGYIAACIFVPLAWGILVARVSNRLDEWVKRRRHGQDSGNPLHPEDSTHVEYHI
jgi:hypothetical protein